MLACLDVHYREGDARAACVVFREWTSNGVAQAKTVLVSPVADYEPGKFYERELPCLLAVIAEITETPDVLIVDGYVWLGKDRPGLGHYLYDALEGKVSVVGVAKSFFEGAQAVSVLRGESQNPLYVTAVGMESEEAARHVASMDGDHRIPTLLRAVDTLARTGELSNS